MHAAVPCGTRDSPVRNSGPVQQIREFFVNGVEKSYLPWAVDALPTLLHFSLFLFFAGLLVFLFGLHLTVFKVVVLWVGLSVGIYGCITLMPIFRPDSPYCAPLSSPALIVYTGVSYGVFRMLIFIGEFLSIRDAIMWSFEDLKEAYRHRLGCGVVRTAHEIAWASKDIIYHHVVSRIIGTLDEDGELEEFSECIPDFCTSKEVHDPQEILVEAGFKRVLRRLWSRTLRSSCISEEVKKKRLSTYVKATNSAGLYGAAWEILGDIFEWDGMLQFVEIVCSPIRWGCNNRVSALYAQGIASGIIVNVPVEKRDSRWEELVMCQLGISEDMVKNFLVHGDSVQFANLTQITRRFYRSYLGEDHLDEDNLLQDPLIGDVDRASEYLYALSKILPAISKFNIQNTLPGLQDDFCALWNEIVQKARIPEADNILVHILSKIRHIYTALHPDPGSVPTAFTSSTDGSHYILRQAASYPLCATPGHDSHEPVVGIVDMRQLRDLPPLHPMSRILAIFEPSDRPDVSPHAHAHLTL